MTPRRVPRPRPIASRARAHLGASRRADLFLGRRLRLRRRLLSRIKNTHPSSVTAPNPTARRVDAHRHRSSIHRVSNESSNHPPPTSASARTTVRDARVVFVALRNGRKKSHPSVGAVIERSRASRERRARPIPRPDRDPARARIDTLERVHRGVNTREDDRASDEARARRT